MTYQVRYEAIEKSKNHCIGKMFSVDETLFEKVHELNKLHPGVVEITKRCSRINPRFFHKALYKRPVLGPFRNKESGSTFFAQFYDGKPKGLILESLKRGGSLSAKSKILWETVSGCLAPPTVLSILASLRMGSRMERGLRSPLTGTSMMVSLLRGSGTEMAP